MDDPTAVAWAEREFGAVVLRYSQQPSACEAVCAVWIRRRSKGKTIFDAKRVVRAPGADAVHTDSQDDDRRRSFADKISALRRDFRDNVRSQDARVTGKGFDSELKYILRGEAAVGLKWSQKDRPHVNVLVEEILNKDAIYLGEDGAAMLKLFARAAQLKCFASFGYSMVDANSHAVALDCTGPDFAAVFFDPLIGQFSFSSHASFHAWWQKCWTDGRRPESADNTWKAIKLGKAWGAFYARAEAAAK